MKVGEDKKNGIESFFIPFSKFAAYWREFSEAHITKMTSLSLASAHTSSPASLAPGDTDCAADDEVREEGGVHAIFASLSDLLHFTGCCRSFSARTVATTAPLKEEPMATPTAARVLNRSFAAKVATASM